MIDTYYKAAQKIFLIFIISIVFAYNLHSECELNLFNFQKVNESVASSIHPGDQIYSVHELVKQALEYGLESQEHLQLLFRAHQEVRTKLGYILPQINVLSTAESAATRHVSIHAVLPLVGFLFPNRWLVFSSTRALNEATKENLVTLFANRVQAIEHIYFDIQMQYWSLRIMDFYLSELDRVIKHIENHIESGSKRFNKEHLGAFINRRATLRYHRAFMDSLAASLPEVAIAIGLSPEFDWAQLQVEPCGVDFVEKPHYNYFDFYADAERRSTEIHSMNHLIKAAKRKMLATYLDFFDPHSGHDLGFAYRSRIKIARSELKSLEIGIENKKREISSDIQHSLNYYTESTSSLRALSEGIDALEYMREEAQKQLNSDNEPFEFPVVDRYLHTAEKQALNIVHSYFVYRTAVADFDRYTWNGKYYHTVNDYRIEEIPRFLKRIKREHSLRYRTVKRIRKTRLQISNYMNEDEDKESRRI